MFADLYKGVKWLDIQVRHFSFESKYDDVKVYGVCMIPDNPIGIVLMVHGMCEHKGRFLHMMRSLSKRGYITLMHDCRGHGESVKKKEDIGYCYASKEVGYVADIHKISQQIKKEYPDLPLFLYGHSMGSLAARVFLRNHDDEIDGLIVAGCPAYNSLVPVGLWGLKLLRQIKGEGYRSTLSQKVVLGSFENRFKHEKRPYAWLAAKESVAAEFQKDELCMFTYTVNGFETLLHLMYVTYKAIGYQVENPDLPILFISGMDDPCYTNERGWQQAIERMQQLGYHDIQDIRYEGMRHEIHNEEDNERVFSDIDTFCRRIIGK